MLGFVAADDLPIILVFRNPYTMKLTAFRFFSYAAFVHIAAESIAQHHFECANELETGTTREQNCTESSTEWHTKYKREEFWIPTDSTPAKSLHINVSILDLGRVLADHQPPTRPHQRSLEVDLAAPRNEYSIDDRSTMVRASSRP